MDKYGEFYTLKGYQKNQNSDMTYAMEDYLEMICRLAEYKEFIRIHDIAKHLHVKPSSVSKMMANLKSRGYIEFEKYGYITLTDKGLEEGRYLLFRHDVINRFLCIINGTESELEQVEKIEHFISRNTVYNIKKWLDNNI